MRSTLIGRFLLLSIVCLIVLLPLWYWSAAWFAAPPLWLAGTAMKAFFPWTESWTLHGVTATLNTLVQVRVPSSHGDALGELSSDVSYPSYGYGLVLLWAMLIAARLVARTPYWWLKGLLGSALLIPVQAWGICFEWLRDVALLSGPSGAAYLGYSAWANNAIAYGYQLGLLMLPPVVPILLWLLFNKRFVAALWLEAALAGAPGENVQNRAHSP
ncbi:MAG: hypothetical protein LBH31_08185 [Burkholderiaceae bacterium]|jgi:hypothetical protein|nr:hypothetical protein [Burkholderiaceae bacterium]